MVEILSFLILFSGGIMSIKSRFVQRHLGTAFAVMIDKDKTGGEISAFGALCTTLAATLGTGNIVGVAGAVALGGPGALVWMVISSFFGMALKYSECFLGTKTRRNGEGGPFVYIENRLGALPARIYALCLAAAGALSMGTTLQMDSVIGVLTPRRGGQSFVLCLAFALPAAWVLWSGAKGIAAFCEKVIPAVSICYILCCIGILCGRSFRLLSQRLESILRRRRNHHRRSLCHKQPSTPGRQNR